VSEREPAGLYLHVPFCARACPYCDFDFEVGRPDRLGAAISQWLLGLEHERLTLLGPRQPARRRREAERARALPRAAGDLDAFGFAAPAGLARRLDPATASAGFDTLYLGGGTPSVLDSSQLRALFGWLRSSLALDPRALREVTVELNPEHVDGERIASLAALGVGRVSLGIQTFDPRGLVELGRAHDRDRARAAAQACVAAGLRTSADLIVGWRGQDPAQLRGDIGELDQLGVEHVSVYGLTIEPDTPWHKLVRRGLRILPDDDHQAELLLVAEAELVARGFAHYEVASYARPGAEAIHNSKYWRWLDVIGLGPSAASVCHRREPDGDAGGAGAAVVERRSNPRGLGPWASWAGRAVAAGGESGGPGPEPSVERLVGEQAAAEGLWLGLRRLRGLDVASFEARFGVGRPWLEARIARQLALGNLEWCDAGQGLRVAGERWLWHDSIAVDLL
jgi:oxygen-independent coproporphyrinogen III oxidase